MTMIDAMKILNGINLKENKMSAPSYNVHSKEKRQSISKITAIINICLLSKQTVGCHQGFSYTQMVVFMLVKMYKTSTILV